MLPKRSAIPITLAAWLQVLGFGLATHASEWNQFRGPNGSGVNHESRPPQKIGNENLAWKIKVPAGFSSPAIWKSKIFLTGLDDGRLTTLAFDKESGRKLWSRQAPKVPLEKVHQSNGHATPSPFADSEKVYAYFGSFGLLCYDHDGKEIWRKTIPSPKSMYGSSTSPIGHGDLLLMVLDNDANLPNSRLSQSKILALRKKDGEVAWETHRPFHRSGWSTPIIWNHGDAKELVVLGNGRLCGYDLKSGEEKWHLTGFSRETISMPLQGNGMVFASASKQGGAPDAHPDPKPFWDAVISFDSNGDKKIERKEMTGHFTFPFRPELPPEHPGYGLPLPKDNRQKQKRLDGIFHWMDKDKDGFWSEKEFISNISIGRGKPMLVAVKPGGVGNVTETHLGWELNRGIPEIPSPLFHRNRIYMVRSGGILTSVHADTGKIVYRERLAAQGHYRASPVLAGELMYLASEEGIISVVKPGDKMEVVHQHKLEEAIPVTPALDSNTLYVRGKEHLWAFRRKS